MQYETHPAAAIFPMMADEAFAALKADIKKHGQRETIVLLKDQILDGRNRYRACLELGIEPDFGEMEECEDPIAYVISLNLHRRHLNKSQWAQIAAKYVPMLAEQAAERMKAGKGANGSGGRGKTLGKELPRVSDNGKATTQAAKLTNTNRQYVADAVKLEKLAPELAEQVLAGTLTIPEAKRQLAAKNPKPLKPTPPPAPNELGHLKKVIAEAMADVLEQLAPLLKGKPEFHKVAARDEINYWASKI